jgi:hypothetical protein
MPLPVITKSTPTVQEATQEIVYDRFWLKNLRVNCPNAEHGMAVATLVPYNAELGFTKDDEPVEVKIKVWERSAVDLDFATLMASILVEITKIGTEQGVL